MAVWMWDPLRKAYIDPQGEPVSADRMLALRDTFLYEMQEIVTGVTQDLVEERITLQQWEQRMRDEVRISYVDLYVASKGGRAQMSPRDWGIVGHMLRDQYAYLRQFTDQITAGMAPGVIGMRARQYIRSASQAFERATTERYGMPRLTQYPGDGQTACHGNCQCHLEIEEIENGWNVYWFLGIAEHCQDCVDMAAEWAPLFVPRAV